MKTEKVFDDGPDQERIYWAAWDGMDYFSITNYKEMGKSPTQKGGIYKERKNEPEN